MSIASWASDVYDLGAFSDPLMGMRMGSAAGGSMAGYLAGGSFAGGSVAGWGMPTMSSGPDIRGVGISFDQGPDRNGLMRVYVRRIRPDGSAAQTGAISEGDTLVTVDGKNVYGLSLTTLRTIVPGPAGSTVKLGFQNDGGERQEIPLKRTTARGSRAANPAFAQTGNVTGNANFQRTNPDKTRAPAPAQVDNDVPLGWEKKMDPKGFVFWVNHEEKKISYTKPTVEEPKGSNQAPYATEVPYGTSNYDPYGTGNYSEPDMPTTQV